MFIKGRFNKCYSTSTNMCFATNDDSLVKSGLFTNGFHLFHFSIVNGNIWWIISPVTIVVCVESVDCGIVISLQYILWRHFCQESSEGFWGPNGWSRAFPVIVKLPLVNYWVRPAVLSPSGVFHLFLLHSALVLIVLPFNINLVPICNELRHLIIFQLWIYHCTRSCKK